MHFAKAKLLAPNQRLPGWVVGCTAKGQSQRQGNNNTPSCDCGKGHVTAFVKTCTTVYHKEWLFFLDVNQEITNQEVGGTQNGRQTLPKGHHQPSGISTVSSMMGPLARGRDFCGTLTRNACPQANQGRASHKPKRREIFHHNWREFSKVSKSWNTRKDRRC